MSRASSRLHMLERGLKKPRKSAAKSKARALTVLRLEGATSRAPAQHVPARLPKDLEDQIAVVRGRAAAKPSRGLLQLEERLLGAAEAESIAPAIQRYDHGAPPPAIPSTPVFVPPPVAQASALSAPVPLAGNAFSGRFNVESFEDTSAAPAAITATPTAPEVQMPTVPWQEPQRNAPTGATPGAVPWAAEPYALRPQRKNLTPEQQEVAAGFERDLAAMLGDTAPKVEAPEDRQWDDTLRSVAQPAPAPSATVAPQPTPAPTPKPDAHEVFNQMGLAMNYANSFDLGAVDLSARFDQFERELALETKPSATAPAPEPVPVQALALDDFDLVADLAAITGAPAMQAPADAETLSPPEPASGSLP